MKDLTVYGTPTLSGALTVSRRQKLLNTAAVHVDDLKSENSVSQGAAKCER